MVYPNGIKEGKGSHLSVFVAIVKGEYDNILGWPFKGKVTFGLRKPWSKDVFYSLTMTFDEHTLKRCCSKPKNCVTMQYFGRTRHISLEDISRFTEGSDLRFIVSKVETV